MMGKGHPLILQILNDKQAHLNDRHGNWEKGKRLLKPCLVIGIIIIILPFLLFLDVEWKAGLVVIGAGIVVFPAAIIGIAREVEIDRSQNLIQRKLIIFGLFKIRRGRWNLGELQQVIAKECHEPASGDDLFSDSGQIFFKFKDGREKLVLAESYGPRPVNCVKVLKQFLKGEYSTPGVITDEVKGVSTN